MINNKIRSSILCSIIICFIIQALHGSLSYFSAVGLFDVCGKIASNGSRSLFLNKEFYCSSMSSDDVKCGNIAKAILQQQLYMPGPAMLNNLCNMLFLMNKDINNRCNGKENSFEDNIDKIACKQCPEKGANWKSASSGIELIWIADLEIWVGRHEVTNADYRLMNSAHNSGVGICGFDMNQAELPVTHINYCDAMKYAKWLTMKEHREGVLSTKYEYRLPTDIEWTLFARCGDKREFPWGNEWPPPKGQSGNYSKKLIEHHNDYPVTVPVDELWENEWGLKGVGGNVWEATSKSPNGDFDAWRGASYSDSAKYALKCEFKNIHDETSRNSNHGFRLVLSSCEAADDKPSPRE